MSLLSSVPTQTRSWWPNSATWGRNLVHAQLSQLRYGELLLEDPLGRTRFGSANKFDAEFSTPIRVTIHDNDFYKRSILQGGIGVGEAYIDRLWETDDLTRLLKLIVRNSSVNQAIDGGWARLFGVVQELLQRLRSNTRLGSRKNIAHHYDLSNEFFALFLDPTLTYSAAIFDNEAESIEADSDALTRASLRKLDTVCRKLQLTEKDHLLEIGSGWGSLAIHAAQNYGCRVTTTTISQRQYDLAAARIAEEGLEGQIELLLRDYRDLDGRYDKLVSIEMIEAIGAEYFDKFFRKCSKLLAPDGLMLLQSITIADRHFKRARREVDFIKKYIFPGCCIPSVGALAHSFTRSTDLDIVDAEDIGPHYATTLRCWLQNFDANSDAIRALGFDERFMRMWKYYLCYCEAGFAERQLRDFQLLLAKPNNRCQPVQWLPR